MRYLTVILAGVRMGAVAAVACTVLNAVHPAGVGLQQAAAWGLAYCGQLVCAKIGGTIAVVWGAIAAAVAGESWRAFGEAFGGAVVATCGAIAGGFTLAYGTAMAPQWQGPHFPGGLAAYLIQSLRWPLIRHCDVTDVGDFGGVQKESQCYSDEQYSRERRQSLPDSAPHEGVSVSHPVGVVCSAFFSDWADQGPEVLTDLGLASQCKIPGIAGVGFVAVSGRHVRFNI
jgi:hypothetical protein